MTKQAKGQTGGRAVHTDPEVQPTPEQEPLPDAVSKKPQEAKSPALDENHEVAIGVGDNSVGPLRIEGIGYFDPDIVTFYGVDMSGARAQLIQHVSQLSVALRALPKPGEVPEPRRIGFRLVEELEAG